MYTWKGCIICCCCEECSINVNWVSSVDSVAYVFCIFFFFCILYPWLYFLYLFYQLLRGGIKIGSFNSEFAYFFLQFYQLLLNIFWSFVTRGINVQHFYVLLINWSVIIMVWLSLSRCPEMSFAMKYTLSDITEVIGDLFWLVLT